MFTQLPANFFKYEYPALPRLTGRRVQPLMTASETKTYPVLTSFLPCQTVPVQSVPLLPTTLPPLPEQLPPLPSPQRRPLPSIESQYELKTHLVPAAYPRVTPYIPDVQPPEWSDDKETWKANVERATEEVMGWKRKQHEGKLPGGAEGHGSTRVLWNCVNRYVRKGLKPDNHGNNIGKPLTLFFAHANGSHKEVSHFVAMFTISKIPDICFA